MKEEFEIGDYIEDFEIIDKNGGKDNSMFGVVYTVLHESKRRIFALKTLQYLWLGSEEVIGDFKKEALILTGLNHPNIIGTGGVDFIGNRPYLMMEPIIPVEGKISLSDYLGNLSIETILDWSIQFCYGMEYINEQGIIAHCDIKPDNILIQIDQVKISDFGLVELNNKYSLSNGSYKGTFAYMAPEAFENKYNAQTDIYSFGVVMYQMVNEGDLPFYCSSDSEQEWKQIHEAHQVPNFDSELYSLIVKCLEKRPENRYSSFRELRGDLEEIYKEFSSEIYVPNIEKDDVYDYYGRAHSFAKYGYVSEAENLFDKILEFESIPKGILVECGICLIEIGLYDKSLLYLYKALDISDDNDKAKIYFNLGHAYQLNNDLETGIAYYNKSICCDENYLKSYVNRGNCYKDLNMYYEAIKNYDYVLEIKKDCWQANYNKAIALSFLEDLTNMNFYFKQSLNQNRDDDVYKEWGEALRRNNKETEAMLKFYKAARINKEFSLAHYNMIISYLLQGKPDLAVDYYDSECSRFNLDEKNEVAHDFAEFGIYDKSGEICDYVIKSADSDLALSNAYSIKIRLSSSVEEAKIFFDKSLSKYPDNIQAYVCLGKFYLQNDLDAEAVDILKEGLIIDSDNFDILFNMGIAFFKQEKFDLSKKYFLKCKEIDANNDGVYLYLFVNELFFYGDGTGLEEIFDEAKSKNLLDEFDTCESILDSILKDID